MARALRNRRWARYPDCFGKLSLRQLLDIAREEGMRCIDAFKGDICCYNSIALYGTREQLERTQERWRAAGHECLKRFEKWGQGPADLDRPRIRWLDG